MSPLLPSISHSDMTTKEIVSLVLTVAVVVVIFVVVGSWVADAFGHWKDEQ